MSRLVTREQVQAWLAERERTAALRASLPYHGPAPQPYEPEWCEVSWAWQRRSELHQRINHRGERAADTANRT